ncbi:MAG: hypothetical protein ACRD3W_02420 [Terriglobales bacterium]
MKKAKARTGTGSARVASAAKPGGREAPDLAEIRRRIADIVGSGAIGMVETTIDQVGKGHYLGMKYLFEMIGLYPATSTDDAAEDSLAAVLLRRLGLPEEPMPETGVTEDSRTASGPAEDSLE